VYGTWNHNKCEIYHKIEKRNALLNLIIAIIIIIIIIIIIVVVVIIIIVLV